MSTAEANASPLAFELIAAVEAPDRWMLFLHGALGRRSNWRSFARRLVEHRPGWGAILVDLRLHGDSQRVMSPHTVEAAAADLLGLDVPGPVAGVLGHSFGGKVALAYLALRGGELDEAWIIDSPPGAPPLDEDARSTLDVLALLERVGPRVPTREALVEEVRRAGFDRRLGLWLAMNLRRSPEGDYRLALDLPSLRQLLDDFFRTDLWSVVEAPLGRVVVHLIIGERSTIFAPADRERALAAAARHPARLSVSLLPTGHWVHVDDPAGLLSLMSGAPSPTVPTSPAAA